MTPHQADVGPIAPIETVLIGHPIPADQKVLAGRMRVTGGGTGRAVNTAEAMVTTGISIDLAVRRATAIMTRIGVILQF